MLAELALAVSLNSQAPAQTARPAARPLPFRVIVHSANPVDSISRTELSAIFLKRVRRWPDRVDIIPVDQPGTSRVRERFTRAIHGKSVAYVTRYWHRLIFSGRGIPPLELSSSSAVVEFVKANRGAIGYVDLTTPDEPEVKEIGVFP